MRAPLSWRLYQSYLEARELRVQKVKRVLKFGIVVAVISLGMMLGVVLSR